MRTIGVGCVLAVLGMLVLPAAAQLEPAPPVVAAIDEADARFEEGNLAEAVRLYLELLERFPKAREVHRVRAAVQVIVQNSTPGELDAIQVNLPPVQSMATVAAKEILFGFFRLRFDEALRLGDWDQARSHFENACAVAWNIFENHSDDFAVIGVVYTMAAMAEELGTETAADVMQTCSEAGAGLGPCVAAWTAQALQGVAPPSIEDVTSSERKFKLCTFWLAWANQAGDLEYFARARDAAWQLMWAYPNSPAQVFIVRYYLESSKGLGNGELPAAIAQLRKAQASSGPTLAAWFANYMLRIDYYPYLQDGEKSQCLEALIAGESAPFIVAALSDPAGDPLCKAWIECAVALAYRIVGRYDEALVGYDHVLAAYPEAEQVCFEAEAGYMWTIALKNWDNPRAAVAALQCFIQLRPGHPYADWFTLLIGDIYRRCGDLLSARQAYLLVLEKPIAHNDVIEAAVERLKFCYDNP